MVNGTPQWRANLGTRSLPEATISAGFSSKKNSPFRNKKGGIRPRAVGDVMRRLIGKSKLKVSQAEVVDQTLFPVQSSPLKLVVSGHGANEPISRGVNYFLNESSDRALVLLQLDFKNAFNACNRAHFITKVRLRAPALAPRVEFLFTSQAPLPLNESVHVLSREGVYQGGPLAPLLFSLAVQPLAEKVGTLPGVGWNARYLDDGNIITTLPGAKAVIDLLLSEGPEHGLFLSLGKTTIAGHNLTN